MLEGDFEGGTSTKDVVEDLSYSGWRIKYTADNYGIDPELWAELTMSSAASAGHMMLDVRCHGTLSIKWVKLPLMCVANEPSNRLKSDVFVVPRQKVDAEQ